MPDRSHAPGTGDAAPPGPLDWRFAAVVSAAFLIATLPRVLLHVPWRDEWHTWQVVTSLRDLGEMLAILRYDGHPALWYVLLWLAAGVTDDVVAMKVIHVALATCTAGVIAAAAPFTRSRRALLSLGYFFVFEYAVVSRNYAPGLLFLFAATAIAHRRPRAYVWIGVSLALAVQSNAFAALLATTIAAWGAARWWLAGRPRPLGFAGGCAVILASLALAAWTARPAPDVANSPPMFDVNFARASHVMASMWRGFAPIPIVGREWWNTNLLDATPEFGHVDVAQGGLGLATFALVVAILPARRGVRALWIAAAVLLFALGYVTLVGSVRHHGHLYVGFLIALWLGAPAAVGFEGESRSWRDAAVTAIASVQAAAGLFASAADVREPFSASATAGAFIAARYPDAAVVGQFDYSAAAVAGVVGRPFYYPQGDRWGTFVRWDRARSRDPSRVDLPGAVAAVAAEQPGRRVLLLLSVGSSGVPDPRRFRLVARFDDSTVPDERYVLLEYLRPDESTATTQADVGRTPAR